MEDRERGTRVDYGAHKREIEKGMRLVEQRDIEIRLLEQQLEDAERRLCRGDLMNDLSNVSTEDFSDMVHRIKNRLQIQEMRNAMLVRERLDTAVQCKHLDNELESLECLIIQIRAATGFCSAVDENFQGTGLNQMEQELAVKELCFLIMVLRKELTAQRTLVAWKDEVISKFQRDVDRQLEFLEKQAQVVKDLNLQEELIRQADAELDH
eukprot:TRINITY_DN3829_c7_g1_i2.p2 TRINITY_DN3829_c7_g1~~TRINITY_DN3829_c7_g1_i2.p2  ORF type:complete len:210 (+),score=62.44 TRINITY_DN3829_c7_g1_i2:304-933(+)